MIIDAGMGRSCCGVGSYSTNPATAYGCCPTAIPSCPPNGSGTPSVAVSAITNQHTIAVETLAVGDSVPFDSTSRVIGTDITYDSTANAFVINTAGTYFFTWDVLTETTDGESDVLLRLQTIDGMTALALSGADNVLTTSSSLVSGSTVATLPVGARVVLVNAGTTPITLPGAGTAPLAFVAGMTVVRIA